MSAMTYDLAKRPVLAICGGGNGPHALAVVASQTFDGDIGWLVSSEEKAVLLRLGVFSKEGLHSSGAITGTASKVRSISSDPAQVIPGADIVMIVAPAFAHAAILNRINPYLKDDALIGSIPTRGGFEFETTNIVSGIEPLGRRKIFGLQTLPWYTRIQETGKHVNFGAIKTQVLMATLPGRYAPEIAAQLSRIFATQIVPTANFLNMTLGNPGQVVHPGLMYGLFSAWSGEAYAEDRVPRFYVDISDETADLLARLSTDILRLAREIESRSAGSLDLSGVLSIHDWLRISYAAQTEDTNTVAACFRTGPLRSVKAPVFERSCGKFVPNFQYRFLSEDVPFGLVVTKSIAQLADVQTPAIDEVLNWAQEKLEKRYLVDGLLDMREAQRLPLPQNYGIDTLPDLIDWYAMEPASAGRLERVAL